jgi:WD40 repeat protein/serine/threonine protein kinase
MSIDTLFPTELSGRVIKGYELLELIGQGGFGAVYRAYQPAVKREVAIKVILPQYVSDPEFIRRFEAEAQIIAHLEHFHIVPLYDYWREAGGAFLVMRWLRGGSLRARLKQGHWPLEDVGRLFDQIGAALSVAHRAGVIHRDLKPDNILLDEDQNAFLADFGIARDLHNLTEQNSLYLKEEEQGRLMGSPHYLSPEQIKATRVSPQTDVYSLGIMLYEVLTGVLPYEGLPLSTIITKHLQEPLPPVHESRPDVPEVFNRIISKATEKEWSDRYPSVAAFNADLRQALIECGILAPPDEAAHLPSVDRTGDLTFEVVDAADIVNPFKGLRAFQEADAADFFGRESLVDHLIALLGGADQSARFLAVVGPSGSGKSSVIKAGLLPRLRQNALPGSGIWFIVEMLPGTHPLEELEAALLRVAVNPPPSLLPQLKEDDRGLIRAVKRILPAGTDFLLVIDQFEEVFTQTEDESARTHFLNLLHAAARDSGSRIRIITTLRADFYDRPLLYPGFGELIRECTQVVLPLTRDELERAITEPIARAGLGLEASLVPQIIADVAEQPGALPLLQFALTELFERRDGRWLTAQAYREIGGVSGALARRANDLYHSLDAAGQSAARQMFLRLITPNEGAEDTRRRVRLDELLSLQSDPAVMQRTVDRFGQFRLLTFDRDPVTRTPTVEIAHEALIRQWDRLREWLRDSREDLRMQRRLASAADEWVAAGRESSFLASGVRLDQFEAWKAETTLALAESERSYLQASLESRDRQRALESERQTREAALERRSRSILKALVGVLAAAALIALILSAVAVSQSRIAAENLVTATYAQGEAQLQAENAATAAAVAEANATRSRGLAFTSGAQLALANNNTDLAILLALEASRLDSASLEMTRTLAEAGYSPGTRRVFTGHTERAISAAFSPDGRLAASASRDNTVIIWEVATARIVHQLEGHTDWVWDAAFSPDGKTLLSASQDNTLILWDVLTGQQLRRFTGHTGAARSLVFDPAGDAALSGGEDGQVILWNVSTGKVVRVFQSAGSPVYDVAYSPSGFTALSGAADGTITLWNAQSGDALVRFGLEGEGHTSQVWSLVYTPDEQGFVSASDDSTLIYWSFESGQPVRRYRGHSTRVTSVDLTSDARLMASGSEDNTILLWDFATGAVIRRFIGHTYLVYGVAFSPDDQSLLSASWDTTLRLWDLNSGAEMRRFTVQQGSINAVAFTPDGRRVLTASAAGTIAVADAATGERLRLLEGHTGPVNAVTVSADGRFALSGSDDLSLILWDIESGELVRRFGGAESLDGHSDAVWAAAFSPDGKVIASGSRDNTIILWDVATGAALNRLFGHVFRVTGLAFSPNGTKLISSGFDNVLILWDLAAGQEIRRFEGHTDWVRSVDFNADGSLILSGSADNTVALWDVASGRRLRAFEGHTAQVYSVDLSPDGRYAVSGAADSTVIVWDVEQGAELQRFTGHTDDVRAVAFSPGGTSILSGSGDATARLWRFLPAPNALVDWIQQNRYIREFTCAERALYQVEPLCPAPTPALGEGVI